MRRRYFVGWMCTVANAFIEEASVLICRLVCTGTAECSIDAYRSMRAISRRLKDPGGIDESIDLSRDR